jgi:hypothetical protein
MEHDITIQLVRDSVAYKLLSTVRVPADSTLVAINKDIGLYILEGDILQAYASASNRLNIICSYEQIAEADVPDRQDLEQIADQYANSVVLLINANTVNSAQNNTFIDSSANNFTVTRVGDTTQGSFSPYGDLWSNYFDGTGDYLSGASSTNLAPGTGDFTMEAWVYPEAVDGERVVFKMYANNPQNYDMRITDGFYGFVYYEIGLGATTPIQTNTWTHLAATRQSGVIKVFVNGVQENSATNANNVTSALPIKIGANQLNTGNYKGYISNIRIVTGTALYTTNFTPPTTPLTAIPGTSLLTCQSNRFIDTSSNNFTVTRSGDVQVNKFSPFNPIASYSPSLMGGSGYFNGTTDFLSLAGASPFAITTSTTPFTIESWVFPTAAGSVIFSESYTGIGNPVNIAVALSATGTDVFATSGLTPAFGYYNGSAWVTAAGANTAVSLNVWSHIACVFTGSTSKIYINGIDVTKTSSPTPATTWGVTGNNGDNWYIGRRWDVTTNPYFKGYISNLRFVKGTAVYTTAFTPPTAPVTAITDTQLLLNFTNAGVVDVSGKNAISTIGNAQISTAVTKYGSGSLAFDGTGDFLRVLDDPNLRLRTGPFTIEAWVRRNVTGSGHGIVAKGNSSTLDGFNFVVAPSNVLRFAPSSTTDFDTTVTIPANEWVHVAAVREGTGTNQFKMYINGTVAYTGTLTTDFNQTDALVVGENRAFNAPMNGYIDDLRITKGLARYTGNFTPPTEILYP